MEFLWFLLVFCMLPKWFVLDCTVICFSRLHRCAKRPGFKLTQWTAAGITDFAFAFFSPENTFSLSGARAELRVVYSFPFSASQVAFNLVD